MLIGLVEMLGAKVEAHWIVLKGHCYWHSGECVREDTDPGPINPPPLGQLVAKAEEVELLCPVDPTDPTSPQHVETITPGTILSTPRTPIGERAITQRRNPLNGQILSKNLEWQRVVSDAFFYTTPCPSNKASPTQVLVRTWSNVKLNLYSNNGPQPHSAWQAGKCELPLAFDLNPTTPEPPPHRGVLYECSNISICDAHGINPQCPPAFP